MLSSDKIIRFVHEEAVAKGVEVPPRMEEAFREQFGDLELKSPDSVSSKLCKPLRAALKLQANQEFEPLFKSVSDAVRLRVGIELGFAQAVAEPSRGKPSIRSILCRFLDQLEDGVEWSTSDLKEWEDGTALYSRIYKYVPFNLKSIEIILGDSAESRLKRNPFVAEHRILLASRHDVEKYLYEFLRLQAGKEWAITDLLNWKSEDGLVKGDTLRERLRRWGDFEDSLAEICSSPKLSAALAVASFRPRKHITNIDQCREHLRGFLASLPEGEEWSPRRLQEWPGVNDGPVGSTIFHWITRNGYSLDLAFLAQLLQGDTPTLLHRNPFTRRRERIISSSTAKDCLVAFLNTLEDDTHWSVSQLVAWEDGDWNGFNLLCWLRRNYNGSTPENIAAVLGSDASVLVRKPIRRKPHVISEEVISRRREHALNSHQARLLSFLASLAPGQPWSPSMLENYASVDFNGTTLCRWIRENIRHEDAVDWLYVLIKLIPADTLAQHPFKRYGNFILNSSAHVNRPESRPFTTSTEEVDWGRLAIPTGTNPENELIDAEAVVMTENLRDAVLALPEDERKLVEDFYADRPVDEDRFSLILAKLREFLGVIEDL